MLIVDHQALVKSLDTYARKTLEDAASVCVEQSAYEVTIEHFLYAASKLAASDVVFILRHYGIQENELQSAIAHTFEQQRIGSQNFPVFSTLLLELLQDAWTIGGLSLGQKKVRTGSILFAALKNRTRYLRHEYLAMLSGIMLEELQRDFRQITLMSSEHPPEEEPVSSGSRSTGQAAAHDFDPENDSPLHKYGFNFTQAAADSKIDPIFCREQEIDQMIDILSRRRKNNPIVVGDAGVGKSAIVEGLALRIYNRDVPDHLCDIELWGLDIGSLQAGASMKGEFEKRLKAVIEQVKTSTRPIILFIDEAHTLIGAGGGVGGSDAANLLKPVLARGELRTIAATTWSEYKKYFEKDPALSRRFQLVKLDEPSITQSITIIRGLLGIYEKTHGVLITDEAVEATARLSARYISGRLLPDKAIDVLDTACARVATSLSSTPRPILHARQNLRQLEVELKMVQRDQGFAVSPPDKARISEIESRIEQLNTQIIELTTAWEAEKAAIGAYLNKRQALWEQIADGYAEEGAENTSETLLPEDDTETEVLATISGEELLTGTNVGDSPAATDTKSRPVQSTASGGVMTVSGADGNNDEELCTDNELFSAKDCEELKCLRAAIDNIQSGQGGLISYQVGAEEVARVIADWTGIPVASMTAEDVGRIIDLGTRIRRLIKGQDQSIDIIHQRLLTAKADLRREGLPLGAFLLVGPSGVGKTETALQIAEHLFGSTQFMTVINMSEYQEKHSLSRLIGSPPGYVGYGEGGVLTEAIRQHPYSVVLLDEVEKADPEVLNLFYQAFDKGEMNDGEGRAIDCKNIVFVLTSNLGTQQIIDATESGEEVNIRELEEALFPTLSEWFKPALLARMEVIPFLSLNNEVLGQIIQSKWEALSRRLQDKYSIDLVASKAVFDYIQQCCQRSHNGARIIDSLLEGDLLPEISLKILTQIAQENPLAEVTVDVQEGKYVYSFVTVN